MDTMQGYLETADAEGETALDPVCGMRVDPKHAGHSAEHGGASFYFCGGGCRTKFLADPDRYLSRPAQTPLDPAASETLYTCPMHPEVRQLGPGACPICGMALEPATLTAEAPPNPELADMTRRLWIGLALAAPVFVLEMAGDMPGMPVMLAGSGARWLQLSLATPVVLWAGWPFFVRGAASFASRGRSTCSA